MIGRQIETAFIAALADRARADGCARLRGSFISTKKNIPARDVYRHAGLAPAGVSDGVELWELELSTQKLQVPAWISIQSEG